MVLSSQTFCDSLIMKLKIPNWESLCNPNLLMNSDYRSGIINQKGETSYAYVDKALLTIDGWISYGVNVGLDADSIRIINRQTSNRTLRQYVEGKSGTYTVYVNVKSITGNVYVNFNQDISKNKKLVKGKNIFQITLSSSENLSSFTLLLEANADIYIHCMKLEPGEHFTGMPAWDRPVEVMKCRRCFRNLNGSKDETIFIGVTDQNGVITFPISTYDMAKTPSVSLKNIWAVADGSIYQEVSVSSTSTRNTILLLTKIPNKTVRLYYSSNDNYFYIDAYNYG